MRTFIRASFLSLAAASTIALSGCTANVRPSLTASAADYNAREYKISPGDKLTLTVFSEPQLSREVEVGVDGRIDLALIGSVDAAGQTVNSLRDFIAAAYGNGYLLNPRVSVEVKNYRPFTILGEVVRSGNYPYLPGLTVKGAVAAAEGYTYRADKGNAYIKRRDENAYKVYSLDRDLQVMPGDVVEIPERSAF